jgi:hypothetical protein
MDGKDSKMAVANEDANLLLFQQILDSLRDLKKDVNDINKNLVGQENCRAFRASFEDRLNQVDNRLVKVEGVCSNFEATKGYLVDASGLATATDNVLVKAKQEDSDIVKRLDAIDTQLKDIMDKLRILSLSWDAVKVNKGALSLLAMIFMIALGVWSGRGYNIYEMVKNLGPHEAMIVIVMVLSVFFGIIIIIWSILNRKKVMAAIIA